MPPPPNDAAVLVPLIDEHDLPEALLAKEGSSFAALARSIVGQQLATKAAAAIYHRTLDVCKACRAVGCWREAGGGVWGPGKGRAGPRLHAGLYGLMRAVLGRPARTLPFRSGSLSAGMVARCSARPG